MATPVRVVLYLALAATIAYVAVVAVRVSQEKAKFKKAQALSVVRIGVVEANQKHLSAQYSDKSGRLLADPPADASQLIDPDTIEVAYINDEDADASEVDWKEFQSHLAEVTGKKVNLRKYTNGVDDVAAVKDGKTQVVALHAADTPYLVNNAGFIPVAVLANEGNATGHRLDMVVRADSSIQSLADFRGRTLTCTTPLSVSGYRAAVALLMQDAHLRPNVDYFITFSLGMKRSVLGLIKPKAPFEAVAVSDDKLQGQLDKGHIKASDFRIIYQSAPIPRTTIGYVYNLQPDLAAKVQQAIVGFVNKGGAEDEATGKPSRFFPIDYKKDFEFVRKIDDSFDPRLGGKPPKAKDPTGPARSMPVSIAVAAIPVTHS
jgi:phosphonate transport system substrate-binding protein